MISKQEAIDIAIQECQRRGWNIKIPIEARYGREGIFWGRKYWLVHTNSQMRGGNAFIKVDADNGEIIKAAYGPR